MVAILPNVRYARSVPAPNYVPVPARARLLLVYGLGGFAMNLTNLVMSQWLYERYVVGGVLAASTFAILLLAGRLTDGLSDPLIAFWTDNLRTPHGRRLPFLRWGTGPFALACVLLWTPPLTFDPTGRALYGFVVTQSYFLMYGLVITPYLALLPELSADPRDRLNLTTAQATAALAGTLVFALTGAILQAGGYGAVALVLAIAVLISFLPAAFTLRESQSRASTTPAGLNEFPRWLGEGLRNTDFHPLLAATSLFWFGLNLVLMLVPRMVQEQLHAPPGAVTLVMLPFIAVNLVGFFICNGLAKRFGPHRCFTGALLLAALEFPLFGVCGPLLPGLTSAQIVAALAALPAAGFAVLPFALLAEVIDRDAKRSGRHREALYFGVQAIFQKSAIGLSVVVFAWIQANHYGLVLVSLLAGAACGLAGGIYGWTKSRGTNW
jgi:glycoside/pentoside/hexuronide:cation symporter, GPH family